MKLYIDIFTDKLLIDVLFKRLTKFNNYESYITRDTNNKESTITAINIHLTRVRNDGILIENC